MTDSATLGDTAAMSDSHSCCSCWKTYVACFILLIAVLFKFKNPLQFYVKFAVYFCMTMSFAIFALPFTMLRPTNSKNIEWISMTLGNMLRIFGMSFEIENEKYLQINQPYILLVNHQSSVDFITMMNPNIWPGGKCTPLAKKELFYTGPFGIAIWLCGITFIDRLHPEKSRNTMKQLAQRINDENLRVWIYPEGTRNSKTELLPFKKGAFHLAIEAQVPIVCMVTSSYLDFYSKFERKFDFGGKVKCRVLPPFQTKGMTSESVNQLVKLMQNKMQKEFDDLNEEIGLSEQYKRVTTKSEDNTQKVEDSLNHNEIENDNELHDSENDFEHLNASSYENFANESFKEGFISDNNNNSIHDEDSKKIK